MDVNGNVVAFGFPARRDITPGIFSRGNIPRTNIKARLIPSVYNYKIMLTRTGFEFFCRIG
jgi:hypothetical protein